MPNVWQRLDELEAKVKFLEKQTFWHSKDIDALKKYFWAFVHTLGYRWTEPVASFKKSFKKNEA